METVVTLIAGALVWYGVGYLISMCVVRIITRIVWADHMDLYEPDHTTDRKFCLLLAVCGPFAALAVLPSLIMGGK